MASYIKLSRELSNKSFYSKDSEKVHLWIHLLISANWTEKEEILGGKPYICKPGQFTTGRKQLSKETGISESKIERLLTYFEKIEQQIEQQKTNTNRLISICNWCKYQTNEQPNKQRSNNDRTTTEQQVNTPKEYKEEKEYIYSEFYDSEIATHENGEEIKSYLGCVKFLFGENELQKKLAWLKLEDQITYIQYQTLVKKARLKGKKISDMLMSGHNEPKYLKGKKSIYLTLNNWLNR